MARPIERFVLRHRVNTDLFYTVRGFTPEATHFVFNAVLFPNDTLNLPKNMETWEKVPARLDGSGLPKLL